ncbi:MAG: type I-C CRISPR-associated endonuclease Cas1c [Muribaculaceae bacterium]|nr:type I-C CRISPR-associated endonuclease Cas1c [Muribaculaceae bacterium]
MRKLLNSLYVTTPEAYLSKDGQNVVVSNHGNELFRIPIQNLESICTYGYQGASPGLMKLCVDNKVGLTFFSPHGRFIARIQGPVSGNVLLRTQQYALFKDDSTRLHLASIAIAAKIYNSRVVLRRFVRDYPDSTYVQEVADKADKLYNRCRKVRAAQSLEELRGVEGESASIYFSAFPHLILKKDKSFVFNARNRRPPTDPVNAMLSLGYSLLAADCGSALEGVGLDPAVGFMHALRPGRQSLALDLMEELRAYVVDRLVLSMINTRQIVPTDFLVHRSIDNETGELAVILTDDGRKKFLAAWQNKKKTELLHPFLKEKVQVGLLPHIQAMLLARYLRNDLDDYPAFFAK